MNFCFRAFANDAAQFLNSYQPAKPKGEEQNNNPEEQSQVIQQVYNSLFIPFFYDNCSFISPIYINVSSILNEIE